MNRAPMARTRVTNPAPPHRPILVPGSFLSGALTGWAIYRLRGAPKEARGRFVATGASVGFALSLFRYLQLDRWRERVDAYNASQDAHCRIHSQFGVHRLDCPTPIDPRITRR